MYPSSCCLQIQQNSQCEEARGVDDGALQRRGCESCSERCGAESRPDGPGRCVESDLQCLGMPKSWKEVSVGTEKLAELAENSFQDQFCHTNSIPLHTKTKFLELLEMLVE